MWPWRTRLLHRRPGGLRQLPEREPDHQHRPAHRCPGHPPRVRFSLGKRPLRPDVPKNGLVFIGPDPDSMERLSDKAALKELIRGTGLTVIPGTKALESADQARLLARQIGYPVMLKACAGGGGRGIRLIRSEEELEENWHQATSEARSAFGDGTCTNQRTVIPSQLMSLVRNDSFLFRCAF